MPKVRQRRSRDVEIEDLRARLAEAEETLNAIRRGDVDAIAVEGPHGSQIFTLESPEQPYRILAERMSEGAATVSADGAITFCNERLGEMIGLPAAKILGSPVLGLVNPAYRERFQRLLKQGFEGESRDEIQFRRHDGSMIPVLASLKVIPAETGTALCLVATDLIEQKRAQAKLQEHAALLDLAHDAIIFRGLEGQIFFWNRGAENLYGWSPEEAVGRISQELLKTSFPESLEAIQELVLRDRLWEGELGHTTRSGENVIVASRWSLLRDESGNPTSILEVNRDVTQRKLIEEKLRLSAVYTRSLIEASLDPLVTISREGKITDVNTATEKITGVSRKDLVGSDFCNYFTEPENARKGYEQVFKMGFVQDYALAIRHPRGKVTDVLYNAAIFRGANGEVEGVFAAARDVSESKQAQKKISKLNEELEARVAARTEELRKLNKELESFNYAVAHDLRAPLRHIHGFAELLAEEAAPVLTESSKHHLDTIQDSVSHMGRLLEDLLSLSRLGRQELRKRPVGLNALVRDVVTLLQPETKGREIEWQIEELPCIECDPALMKQVLFNLLSNALKFTKYRKPAVIEIGEILLGGENVVFIRDNGVGFNMKYADKLFGVFQRLHRQQDFEGTGVGLAIVQRIVDRHGGCVWAEAELDKGATFYLSLPTCEGEKQEPAMDNVAV